MAFAITAHDFSFGLLNPVLGYAMSCLGAFLGLRCVALARCYAGRPRFRWLGLAAVSIGVTGIWAMHFIAMLGFTVPGQVIYYNVPLTIGSVLIAVAVVGIGLYIAGPGPGAVDDAFNAAAFNRAGFPRPGFGMTGFDSARFLRDGGQRLLAGGVIVGGGVAVVHYLGMTAMSMRGTMSYNVPLVAASVLVAVVATTVALWIGTWIRGRAATVGAALVMGVAVSGMHYTGMAAVDVRAVAMPSMAVAAASGRTVVSGAAAATFLIPLLLVISLATFVLTLTISLAPSEREISADAEMTRQLRYLEQRRR